MSDQLHQTIRTHILDLLTLIVEPGGLRYEELEIPKKHIDSHVDAILDAVINSVNELPTSLIQLYDTTDTLIQTKDIMALLQSAKSISKESE